MQGGNRFDTGILGSFVSDVRAVYICNRVVVYGVFWDDGLIVR